LNLDDYAGMFQKLERRLRNEDVVRFLSNAELELDTKEHFQDRGHIERIVERMRSELGLDVRLLEDELHSAHAIGYRAESEAERVIDLEAAQHPEYRRLRMIAKKIADVSKPPFIVAGKKATETIEDPLRLLTTLKDQAMRDASIQRYKGLGEM